MMASKPRKPAAPETEKLPRKAVPLIITKGDSEEVAARKFAVLATSPELAAYRAISATEGAKALGELIDAPAMIETLRDQGAAVNRGDLSQAEAMLMNQATALQTLFSRLAERAMGNDTILAFEANMRMALRAQSQCRATLQTLAEIKNPPIVYAKQANIAHNQQVNNDAAPSRARENEIEQTQQSGGGNELLPDARASSHASRIDPVLEALGTFNRAKDAGR